MSTLTERLQQQWTDVTNLSGVTTASLIVVMLVGTAVGALVGVLAADLPTAAMTMAAGLLATIAAGVVRNTLLVDAWGSIGVEDAGTPLAIIINAALASFAGSLAADRIALYVGSVPDMVVGALAGLLSAALLGLLMIIYRMNPEFPENRW